MNCIICGRSTGAGIQDTCSAACWVQAMKIEKKDEINNFCKNTAFSPCYECEERCA